MKKYLILLFSIFLFLLFNTQKTNAQSNGTCIIKQQEKTYTVNTPFYWYEVYQITTLNNDLTATTTYNHTKTLINNKDSCLKINNSTPSYSNDNSDSLNAFKITSFYFSSDLLTNSEHIFNKSTTIFDKPDMLR